MIPWIIMAVIAVPLVVLAYGAMRRQTKQTEQLAEQDEETARRTEQEFADAERYEEEWREAPSEERDFLQGLVHVTVAWHHAGNGNQPGASRQLEKAAGRLGPYAPDHRDVDVARVLGQVEAASARVSEGLLDLLPVRI